MLKVRDKVTHVDYPGQIGLVVAREKSSFYNQGLRHGPKYLFLISWERGGCSRHIESALKRA